ncbi:hypothetical protein [Acinetobacter proteolyticus]|uniref:Uncharacterized protein n=1 Tax=Acinetobacter proteolyticus TaxID=1776741 RepID=A0A2N0WIA9_9GAMM|nr:hypothetical protein [Acinetobacter proteolyticus]PKF35550.1 hypothetical protein CW311_04475 [Acinetobacter proteolyticus]
MDINSTALKITTPHGSLFAIFPNDAQNCELHGFDVKAVHYFKSNLDQLFKEHGRPLTLEQLEPEELMLFGNRGDLEIKITDDFDREELTLL